ncbi:DNA pilot protein [robinz microvirus RP_41]|nr:DNA pilot protein [robinz microvirus RP_41]
MSIISNMWHTIGGGDVGGPIHDVWDQFTGASQAHEANETSINLANTSVQRRKADLIAAGMNPMLAVGQGADTPGIRQAPSLGEGVTRAVEAYKTYGASQLMKQQSSAAAAKANLDNAQADFIRGGKTELTGAQTKLTQQEAENAKKTFDKIDAEIANIKKDTGVKAQEEALKVIEREIKALTERELRAILPVIQARAKNEYGVEATAWGRVGAKARAMLPAAGVIGGSAAAIRSLMP